MSLMKYIDRKKVLLYGTISCSVLVLALWCGYRVRDFSLYAHTYIDRCIGYEYQDSLILIADAINKQISMDPSLICVDRYNPKPLPLNIDSISENAIYIINMILPDYNGDRHRFEIEIKNGHHNFITAEDFFYRENTNVVSTEIMINSFDSYFTPDMPVDKQRECMKVFEKFIDDINRDQNLNIEVRKSTSLLLVLLEVALRWPSELVVHACNRDNGDN